MQQLMTLDWAALGAHIVNIVMLNALIQSHHHLKIGLPSKSPLASEYFCPVSGQVPD